MRRASPSSILAATVLALLAGSTYWLVQRTLPADNESVAQPKRHVPDYYADQITISMLAPTGQTQYRINAAHMQHYEDDATTAVTLPAVRAFSPGEPEVTVTSKRGVINGDSSIIDLYDDAVVTRAPGPRDPAMQATSEHFQVLINDDIVRTELPVKLVRGLSVMTATGMIFNNATRTLQLLSNVRGTIQQAELQPSASPAPAPAAR